MNLEDMMLGEISQTEKDKHCMWNYKHLYVDLFFLRKKKMSNSSKQRIERCLSGAGR